MIAIHAETDLSTDYAITESYLGLKLSGSIAKWARDSCEEIVNKIRARSFGIQK